MRDETYFLDAACTAEVVPPFTYQFVALPWPAHGYRLRDGVGRELGTARTRRGARAGLRALYAARSTEPAK